MNPALIVKVLTLAGLIGMMLSVGLKVTVEEVLASTGKVRIVLLGVVANFVLVPAVTIGLLNFFHTDPIVSAGFLILAVCPAAPVGPPFAAIARGNVPSAVGQMVILSGLSALLAPLLLSVLLTRVLPPSELHIDYLAIVRTLLIAQVLPLGIGLGIRRWAPKLAAQLASPVGLLANLMLLTVIVLVVFREYDTLESIRLRGWFGMLLLLTCSLGIGWLCGGPERATRKAMSLTTAARNAGVALAIAATNFADARATSGVVACALVSIFGSLGCAFLFRTVD